jgi:hypothetical protein
VREGNKVKSVSTLHERDSYAGVVCVHARVNRDMAIMKRRDVRDPEKSRIHNQGVKRSQRLKVTILPIGVRGNAPAIDPKQKG